MRFLSVYSETRFWTRYTNSEKSSNNSEKNQKNFSNHTLLQITENLQKAR